MARRAHGWVLAAEGLRVETRTVGVEPSAALRGVAGQTVPLGVTRNAALQILAGRVYVGRFIGFNSWDAVVHPARVADVVREQLFAVPGRTAAGLLALAAFLLVGYLAVYSFTGLNLELERDDDD